jgi:ribose transport system ATP-binding protein
MTPALVMEHISKSFPGVRALTDVSLHVMPGEVHALLGENGAGKSTLIKILMGVYSRDSGRVLLDGTEHHITSPIRARELGLAAVYQDVMMARHLSVGENFFLGRLPRRGPLIDWKRVYRETDAFLASLGIEVDSRVLVGELTIARQQLVAIAKVVWAGAKVIVFDEPTALLTNTETETLFGIIARLKQDGKSIVYISHRLEEVFRVCDSATVLKDGAMVRRVDLSETNEHGLVAMMVGRQLEEAFPQRRHVPGATVLAVHGLETEQRLRSIDFELHAGEILGLYGLIGAGRTELLRVLFGADKLERGEIVLRGTNVHPHGPGDMIGRKIGLVCEDRRAQSLALPMDVRSNINLVRYRASSRLGFINSADERDTSRRFIDTLNIRTPSPYARVLNLSGGNQQKVVIAKWLAMDAEVLLFDEPTIGVDVGARLEIYMLMQELAEQGKAMMMASSYLPEVIAMSDRIMVLHEGRMMGIVSHEEASEEKLLRLASGLPLQ